MQDFLEKIEWSPTIGDPTFMGWFTVFAYLLCSYKSFMVFRHGQRIFTEQTIKQQNLWFGIGVVMLLLGINKQLDLQTFFTATARYFAHEQGWYEHRRIMQKAFILSAAISALSIMFALIAIYYKVIRRHVIAIVGLCTLVLFVLARAVSFHHIDIFIGLKFMGLHMNWILELSGIFLVFHNARRLVRQKKPLIDITQLQQPANYEDAGE